ncbi:MAG: hypothetical protein CR994_01295 [Maribacter sp.]|nr:MAG: hypothetical protein CR994_01295 [Maribacter sp.]
MSLVSLLLVGVFFVPSVVKLSHALNGHKDTDCSQVGTLHMHEIELDCDFHDFNLSPLYSTPIVFIATPLDVQIPNRILYRYTYLNKYQKLHFALRAPPLAS